MFAYKGRACNLLYMEQEVSHGGIGSSKEYYLSKPVKVRKENRFI